ncbi:MAG: hypothetical protein UHK60_11970 [Acutalibacteraceae bacterium]|nr:hypothetical protein [Acutalibacteraceae bacterium]
MLLTETIKKTTTAIETRRATIENKQSAERYSKALSQLSKQYISIKNAVDCVKEIKDKKIVESSVFPKSIRDSLLSSVISCGSAIDNGTLTSDAVKVLQTKADIFDNHLKIIWKDAASKYSDGTKGYLSMISGFTDDPQKAKELSESITKTVNGTLSIKAINKLVDDVNKAKVITESFSLNQTIEIFLKKVSAQQATVTDLTPEVLQWLKDKKLLSKLKVSFN